MSLHGTHLMDSTYSSAEQSNYTLWIDGVGVFQLFLGSKFTVGGMQSGSGETHLSLLADLSDQHAHISRSGEGYLFESAGNAEVQGREAHRPVVLNDGYRIQLGRDVQLRFRQPTALSRSACIDFESDHRPGRALDGIVLMAETVLLGPGNDCHIVCPEWESSVMLVRKEGQLFCQSKLGLSIDGQLAPDGNKVQDGSVVTGPELRFRLEAA